MDEGKYVGGTDRVGYDEDNEDDQDDASVVPLAADLRLIKNVSDPSPIVGDTVLFTIVVINDGPDDATGVSVVDVVPAGFGSISTISDGGVLSGSTITWTGLSIPNGKPR